MQLDLNLHLIPQTLDLIHVILAGVALLAILAAILLAARKPRIASETPKDRANVSTLAKDADGAKTAPEVKAPSAAKAQPALKSTEPESALQLLSLLQQDARLLDFLSEDINAYSDAEVGAAARVVHEGGQKVLADYFTLAPIRSEEEETRITLPEGYDASSIRLTGNVVGQPPFSGILVHRGWQVKEVRLPKTTEGRKLSIVAPAEVEL
ncbi:Conserved hypothetical protein [gamma proteobacterium HdN1]|nr:Conserved hypothetical protein [gamma proteobacterium HdN1]